MTSYFDTLPHCLADLSRHQKEQMQSCLANNEVSTDEELVTFWVSECGIPQEAADAAIKFRPQFFIDCFLDLLGLFTQAS